MRFQGLMIVAALALTACSNSPFGKTGRQVAAELAGQGPVPGTGVGIGDTGAAPLTAVSEASTGFLAAEGRDRVLFPVNEATLTPEAIDILDAQAVWLANNPSYSALIEGHADEQGTRDYNIALGERRASTVYNYLLSRGVDAGRLTTVSYGKERPVAVCSDESCWSQNRRAVTLVAGGLTG